MEILAELYKSAEKHLSGPAPVWDGFFEDFQRIFSADGVLYRIGYAPAFAEIESFHVIGSSNPATVEKYVGQKMYLHSHVPESDLEPLEPARRTDALDDDAFEKLGPLADFFISVGMYYLMAVPARLSTHQIVTLSVWRSRGQGDFSDLEKQRLALFTRHLLAVVDDSSLSLEQPVESVSDFGRKWRLTNSETEILAALLQGLSLKQVANLSGRSYGTVRWHMQNILSKCQVGSQKELLHEFYSLITR